jgi:hypothetical protein
VSLGTPIGLPSDSTRLSARSEKVSRPRLSITSLAASASARSSVARFCTKPRDRGPITSGREPAALADWIWLASWSSAIATTLTWTPLLVWKRLTICWMRLTRWATSSASQNVMVLSPPPSPPSSPPPPQPAAASRTQSTNRDIRRRDLMSLLPAASPGLFSHRNTGARAG